MIYVHIPFCHRKCTYCAFYSKPLAGNEGMEAYVDALLREMELRHGEQAHPIRTLYFGGGTPSLLPVGQLARLAEGLRRWFDLSQVEEATLEANPEDLTPAYLADLRSLGLFNRLSIGVQSLDDSMLRLVGRRHTAAQALDALCRAHDAGFGNLGLDLIYGLPADVRLPGQELRLATHVSAYALTVEPGTALAVQVGQGRVRLPDDEEVVRQYHRLRHQLAEAGFVQYEVSNFARPGFASRHNSRYWDRTPYLGLGPAAHSFDGLRRRWNVGDVGRYVAMMGQGGQEGLYEEEALTRADAYNELLMTSLRTTRGLHLAEVPEEYEALFFSGLKPYVDCGWVTLADGRCVPTEEGLLHADGMAAALFA